MSRAIPGGEVARQVSGWTRHQTEGDQRDHSSEGHFERGLYFRQTKVREKNGVKERGGGGPRNVQRPMQGRENRNTTWDELTNGKVDGG